MPIFFTPKIFVIDDIIKILTVSAGGFGGGGLTPGVGRVHCGGGRAVHFRTR